MAGGSVQVGSGSSTRSPHVKGWSGKVPPGAGLGVRGLRGAEMLRVSLSLSRASGSGKELN